MGQALVPTQSVHIQAPVGRHGNYGKWVQKVDRCHARPLLASIHSGKQEAKSSAGSKRKGRFSEGTVEILVLKSQRA